VILHISHGYQVQDDHDPFVELAENGLLIFAKSTTQGAFLVDVLPFRMPRLRATMADTEPYHSPVCSRVVSRCWLQDHGTQMECRNFRNGQSAAPMGEGEDGVLLYDSFGWVVC